MTVSDNPIFLQQFREIPQQFQHTFQTPLQKLQPFVGSILSTHQQIQGGCVTIDQVVFEPKHLVLLLSKHSLPVQCGYGRSITAASLHEIGRASCGGRV